MKEIKGVIIRPAGMTITCTSGKGEMLDYAVVSTCLQTAVTLSQARYSPWKPHVGLELHIWGDPPAQEVQAVGCTKGLPDIIGGEKEIHLQHKEHAWRKALLTATARLDLAEQGILGNNTDICTSRVAMALGNDGLELGKQYSRWSLASEVYTLEAAGIEEREWDQYIDWKRTVPKAPSQSGQGSKTSRHLGAELVP